MKIIPIMMILRINLIGVNKAPFFNTIVHCTRSVYIVQRIQTIFATIVLWHFYFTKTVSCTDPGLSSFFSFYLDSYWRIDFISILSLHSNSKEDRCRQITGVCQQKKRMFHVPCCLAYSAKKLWMLSILFACGFWCGHRYQWLSLMNNIRKAMIKVDFLLNS